MIFIPPFLEFFCEDLDRATSIKAVEKILWRLADRAELTHVIYHLPVVPGHTEAPALTLMTYPQRWASHYVERKYFLVDPVVSVHLYSILPVDWNELPRATKDVRTIFGEAEDFGVGPQGLTFPIRGRFGEIALFSVTSTDTPSAWSAKLRWLTPHLKMAAYMLHKRVLELAMENKRSTSPSLSPRERQCISFLAAGMRDADIADRLKISRRVASAYIESLRYKLGAPTRSNAVARALKFGIITLDEL
jgi:DNA-binding CsgD family transcriptional regulator